MPQQSSITPSFALKVLAPSIVAVTSIALLLLYIVNSIFEETNRLDRDYSERLTTEAVSSLRDSLESIIIDNTVWDDAASNAGSATINAEWADNTWGYATALDVYDAAFIVSADGETLYSALNGERRRETVAGYFGDGLEPVLDSLAPGEGNRPLASGFIRTGGYVTTVAAAPIQWSTALDGRPNRTRNILILAKRIDEKVLAGIARRYAMQELRLAEPSQRPAGGSVVIRSPAGEAIGMLTWKNRSPGDMVREKYANVVAMVLVMFLFMVAVLLYMSWKGFKDAHDSHVDAVAASLRDDLTGLANRREMISALSQCLEKAQSQGTPLSMIYADLDGFKEVNDSYGHEIGDMLLRAAAAGFAYLARDADVVARLGGDEFAIIMTGAGCATKARATAQSMIEFLAEPMVFDGRIASVSVSVGIVDLDSDDADVEEIIRRADVAMYAAKSQGRNCVQIYQKSLDFKREVNRTIAHRLREHIDNGALKVLYQPIVDARTRKIKGVEALVRWPSDAESFYTPDVFIPVAEEFGLIEDLGLFVLRESARQAAAWPDIFVAVNVSPIQFMNPNFADNVEDTLRLSGLAARRLEIEVTEGFIIDNAARANTIINRLHDMHVRVALDDFGTGFSSIGHLRRFKFDKLKLDRSMVTDILRQPSALRLVQGTIAMADALGLTVLAEGIEDENQVSVLRLAGCNQFQGFLFSRPVEAEKIMELLGEEPDERPAALAG
jgi:diguanylate cyclase (GGDEF)-like protein